MKTPRRLKIAVAIALLALAGCISTLLPPTQAASNCTVIVNPPDPTDNVTGLNLYTVQISGLNTTRTLVASLPPVSTNHPVALPAGMWSFVARWVAGSLESRDSNVYTTNITPSSATGLIIAPAK